MIIYNSLQIERAIMHRIYSKVTGLRDYAEVEPSNTQIALNDNLKKILIERIQSSFGNQSKSFELSVENVDDGSCFNLVKDLHDSDDEIFISTSKDIAELLATAQSNKQIPGGYFLLLDCKKSDEQAVYVCLKAEAHNALNIIGHSAQALENIILSPAQKMYKAVVFEQISTSTPLCKDNFKVYLFDSQFSFGSRLAEYFYKDFLGLTINDNSKILTKRFYELMDKTIDEAYPTNTEKSYKLKNALSVNINSLNNTIHPNSIVSDLIDLEKRDLFIRKVVNQLPSAFTKDISLLQNVLKNKNLHFGDSIRLCVRSDKYNDISISNDPGNPNIKIVKITI